MAAMGSYDSTLQMFVQKPQPIDMSRLSFMRWLAEQGKLEHPMAGPSSTSQTRRSRIRKVRAPSSMTIRPLGLASMTSKRLKAIAGLRTCRLQSL